MRQKASSTQHLLRTPLSWTPDRLLQGKPRKPALQASLIRSQAYSADRCGMSVRPWSLASSGAHSFWAPKMKYQITNKLETRASRARLPRVKWRRNRDISHQGHPSRCLLLPQQRLRDRWPGLQEPNTGLARGMDALGKSREAKATLRLVTGPFSHLLHVYVSITVLEQEVWVAL